MHMASLTIPKIAFTWYVLIGSAATFLIGSLFSLILPKARLRSTVAMLLLLLSTFASFAQPSRPSRSSSPSPAPDFTSASTLITDAIAQHKLPGAVLLVGHNGRIVFEHAYGNRALEPTVEPMTEDTIFDMASLSKVIVTTTAILQLYEQGKLDLDAPVAQYLPDFAANGKDRITVRELMTHYSGLPEDVHLKDDWGLAAPDKAEGIRRAMASVPYGPPGQTFKYSDINFITLGYLVETISGQPLDMFAREHIFDPLDMRSTSYHPFDKTCGPAIRIGAAVEPGPKPIGNIRVQCLPGTWSPYALDPGTAPTAHDNEGTATTNPDFDHLLRGTVHDPSTRRMGGVAGHAGVFSTAHDMSLFAQALSRQLLHNTGPFPLKQSTLQLATSPQAPATAVTTATIFTAQRPNHHRSRPARPRLGSQLPLLPPPRRPSFPSPPPATPAASATPASPAPRSGSTPPPTPTSSSSPTPSTPAAAPTSPPSAARSPPPSQEPLTPGAPGLAF